MAKKRDIGNFYMIEIVYQKKNNIGTHKYHQYSFVGKRLYNSKKDAVQAVKYSQKSIIQELCFEKNTHIENVKVFTTTVKKCTVHLWDTSRV
jgi:hypothetical protein